MPKSRVVNSMVNIVYSFGVKMATFFASFVLRTVFIRVLGMEYAGVSGLFTDILTVLSFAELGISTAMTYALYKPLADNDENKIQKLMFFYKWAYRLVAGSVLIVGLLCVPLLPMIIKEVPDIEESIVLIYILYLMNTVSSYLLVYKSTLLIASQRNYEISKITIRISIIKCFLGCMLLLVFRNFIIYLLMEILLAVFQNILIGKKAKRMFPHAFENTEDRLNKNEIKKLFDDIKALFFYKVSGVVLNGTDSIIISSFMGTSLVGILSNYNLIVKNIYKLILQIFSSTSASIGNLAVTSNNDKQYEVFKVMLFMSFWLFGFCAVELYVGLNIFMIIWMGKENIFTMDIVIVLILDFYITGMMSPVSSFRTSNGLFVQGKYRPLLMAAINIFLSIVLVNRIGVLGVLLGTVISRLLTQSCYDPYLIYKYVFKRPIFDYFRNMIAYTGIIVICGLICQKIPNITNIYVNLIVKVLSSALIFNGICFIVFGRSKEFIYLKKVGINLVNQVKKRKVRK